MNTATITKLQEEADRFEHETHYAVAEILDIRGITLDDVTDAEATGTHVCVKIPSSTEANLTPALVRAVLNGEIR